MTILTNEYKSNIGKQITWFVFIVIIVAMSMLAFPIINDPSVQPIVASNLRDIPEMIRNIVFPEGIESISNLRLYFKTMLIFVSLMVSIFALNMGLSSLAREQGYGTIDYIFINPITRGEILTYKFIANTINLIILVILLLLANGYAYSYIGDLDLIETLTSQIQNFIVIFVQGMFFLCLGTMISSFSRRTSGLGAIGSLIIIGFLILNILISGKMIDLPGHQFIPLRILQESFELDRTVLGITLGIGAILPSLIFLLIGYVNYERKDLLI